MSDKRDPTTKAEAADIIDRFIKDRPMGDWEWEEFCSPSYLYADPLVAKAAAEACDINWKVPSKEKNSRRAYCNEQGYERLRELRDELLGNKNIP